MEDEVETEIRLVAMRVRPNYVMPEYVVAGRKAKNFNEAWENGITAEEAWTLNSANRPNRSAGVPPWTFEQKLANQRADAKLRAAFAPKGDS